MAGAYSGTMSFSAALIRSGSKVVAAAARRSIWLRTVRSRSAESDPWPSRLSTMIFSCAVAVSRSGAGSLAEMAAFRRPAILVPYPQAFADHQLHNALEFEEMGAATIVRQTELQPSTLESRILLWQQDEDLRARAQQALAEWDIPDSAARIVRLLEEAAAK